MKFCNWQPSQLMRISNALNSTYELKSPAQLAKTNIVKHGYASCHIFTDFNYNVALNDN
jgi:hypothetical protein